MRRLGLLYKGVEGSRYVKLFGSSSGNIMWIELALLCQISLLVICGVFPVVISSAATTTSLILLLLHMLCYYVIMVSKS